MLRETLRTVCDRVLSWRRLLAVGVAPALLLAVGFVLFFTPARAADITVNTTVDELTPVPNGFCSLREAIANANNDAATYPDCPAGSGSDTITLAAGTYALTIPGTGEDAGLSGDLDITGDLTLLGAGADSTVIDAAGLGDRVLNVVAGSAILSDLALQNGSAVQEGGGLRVNAGASASAARVRIQGNSVFVIGGGIAVAGTGALTLNNSSVLNNAASYSSGAIANDGTATIIDATIEGNTSAFGPEAVRNGGVLTVKRSTINANSGGILHGFFLGGDTTLENVTISGNDRFGLFTLNSDISVTHATIAGNGTYGINAASSSEPALASTIVAGNGTDCIGAINSLGYNLAGDNSCGLAGPGDLNNTDPLLDALADNGGLTRTHALLDGSPAIDAITAGANGCGTTILEDQRGEPRPQGDGCDIGAYETAAVGDPLQAGPVFTVNTADDLDDETPEQGGCTVGHCSLREAINAANARPNDVVEEGPVPDEIWFDLAGAGPHTIQPGTALPTITEAVIVDGLSQAGATCDSWPPSLQIELDGSLNPGAFDGLLLSSTDGGAIKGLVVNDFDVAIHLAAADGADISCNFLGTDIAGANAQPNNVGISIQQGSQNTIGANGRNLIAGNLANQVVFDSPGGGAASNRLEGNYIGTNASGSAALGSGDAAVSISRSSANIVSNNLIAGSGGDGVLIVADAAGGADNNVIEHNIIGLDASQAAALPNGGYGIVLEGQETGSVAGTAIAHNVIAANELGGIHIQGATGTSVSDNHIGLNADGTLVAGNGTGSGILIDAGTLGAGAASGSVVTSNTIVGHQVDGIRVLSGAGHSLISNSIYANEGLGIDLGGDGVNFSDFFDPDTGPNNLQNPPILQRATVPDAETLVQGYIFTNAASTIDIQLFASSTCDPSFYGQGKTLLDSFSVETGDGGYASFLVTLPTGLADGTAVTALATNAATGDTSEFSRCVAVGPNNDSWPNAFPMDLQPTGFAGVQRGTLSVSADPIVREGSAEQYLTVPGQARWFRFPVEPGATVVGELTNLPANYDLILFRDIAKAYAELTQPQTVDDLALLNAEFAPDMFSPDMFSPDMFSPDMFSPDMFSPDMFSPDMFSPDMFSPDMFSPDMFSPDMFSPDMFSPDMFSPDMFSPDMFSPDMFSPDMFSAENFSPDMFSPDMFSPDMFSPDQSYFVSAQARSAVAVSGFDGTADETVVAKSWNESGDFYIRVNGRNGVYNPRETFSVNVTVYSGDCSGITPVYDPASTIGAISPGDLETLILVDYGRMARYGDLGAMQASLNDLAAAVSGIVVDVGADPAIQAANAQADSNIDCVYAKNVVANTIKAVVDAYRANHPIQYLVIVGNDDIVPFFRYADQALLANESGYVPPVQELTTSQASLRLGYVLGQDEYGAALTVNRKNTVVPVPGIPAGRLVERPDEVVSVVEAFLDGGGQVPAPAPGSGYRALVTGYDFLTDSSLAVQEELSAGMGAAGTIDTLINPADLAPSDPATWTADDLRALLLESDRHDLVYLAGHFSAHSALAADYATRLLASEIASSAVDMTNMVVFSEGCHSGYNIVNEHGIPEVTVDPDWAQAFARKGATLIAGTGYQYGDSDFIKYGERLYLAFAGALREGTGPVAVGDALVRAKQIYLAETANMRPIDEKTLLQATLFGLPMLTIDLPSGRGTGPAEPSIVTNTEGFATDPGLTLGLAYADITVTPAITPVDKVLNSTIEGDPDVTVRYYEGEDGVVVNPGEPVLPLARYNVSAPSVLGTPDLLLRGVGFRSGSYSDLADLVPLSGAPATELRGIHTPFVSSVFYPVVPWDVNYFDVLANSVEDGATTLAVMPFQFRSNDADSIYGTMRTFSSLSFRLYYSNNLAEYVNTEEGVTNIPALATPPKITLVYGREVDGAVDIQATVTGDPSAGMQEVWVTYTGMSGPYAGQWQSLDLARDPNDSRVWKGLLPLDGTPADDIRYMVQAVNGVGLHALATNRGRYYIPNVDPGGAPPTGDEAPPQPTTLVLAPPPTSGAYSTEVSFEATLTADGTPLADQIVQFGLTAQRKFVRTDAAGVARATLTLVSEPALDTLRVTFDGARIDGVGYQASSDSAPFEITPIATALALQTEEPVFAADGKADLTIALTDATGRPLREKSVLVAIRDGVGDLAYAEVIITDLFGNANLLSASLASGTYQVNADFGSVVTLPTGTVDLTDPRYLASTAQGISITSNTPPTAVAGGPYAVDEGGAVELDGNGSYDPNTGQTLSYAWDLDGDGIYEAEGQIVTFYATNADGPTTVSAGLQVCDSLDECDSDTAEITVNNVPPTINSVTNNGPVNQGQPVTITVDATDPVDALSYSFDCDDDGVFEIGPQAGASAQCSFDQPGDHVVNVLVDDGDDGTATGDTLVEVLLVELPTIDAGEDQIVFEGDEVFFEGTSSDDDAGIIYTWDFGDGGTASGLSASHVYAVPGVYTARLTASAGPGAETSDELEVTVLHGFFRYCVYASAGSLDLRVQGSLVPGAGSGLLTSCALGAEGDIRLQQGSQVDGYIDGRDGSVTLRQDVVVQGAVTASGSVSVDPSATVYGPITSYAPPSAFPQVTPLTLALTAGTEDITVARNSSRTLNPGSYGKLEVGSGATLTLLAGHYHFTEIRIPGNATIVMDVGDDTLLVDVTGNVIVDQSLTMTMASGTASDVLFRVAGNSVTLKKEGTFVGTFLAPAATVAVHKGGRWTGALYGASVSFQREMSMTAQLAVPVLQALAGATP